MRKKQTQKESQEKPKDSSERLLRELRKLVDDADKSCNSVADRLIDVMVKLKLLFEMAIEDCIEKKGGWYCPLFDDIRHYFREFEDMYTALAFHQTDKQNVAEIVNKLTKEVSS